MTMIITPNKAKEQLDTLNAQALSLVFEGVAEMIDNTTYCVFTAYDQLGASPSKVIFIPEQAIRALRDHVYGNDKIKVDVSKLVGDAAAGFKEHKADPSKHAIEGASLKRVERAFQLAMPS